MYGILEPMTSCRKYLDSSYILIRSVLTFLGSKYRERAEYLYRFYSSTVLIHSLQIQLQDFTSRIIMNISTRIAIVIAAVFMAGIENTVAKLSLLRGGELSDVQLPSYDYSCFSQEWESFTADTECPTKVDKDGNACIWCEAKNKMFAKAGACVSSKHSDFVEKYLRLECDSEPSKSDPELE